jgi:hypothetical protein
MYAAMWCDVRVMKTTCMLLCVFLSSFEVCPELATCPESKTKNLMSRTKNLLSRTKTQSRIKKICLEPIKG